MYISDQILKKVQSIRYPLNSDSKSRFAFYKMFLKISLKKDFQSAQKKKKGKWSFQNHRTQKQNQ